MFLNLGSSLLSLTATSKPAFYIFNYTRLRPAAMPLRTTLKEWLGSEMPLAIRLKAKLCSFDEETKARASLTYKIFRVRARAAKNSFIGWIHSSFSARQLQWIISKAKDKRGFHFNEQIWNIETKSKWASRVKLAKDAQSSNGLFGVSWCREYFWSTEVNWSTNN